MIRTSKIPQLRRIHRLPTIALLVVVCVGLAATESVRADVDEVLRRTPVDRDVAAEILADGRLLLQASTADVTLLTADFVDPPGRRRYGNAAPPRVATSYEGQDGGLRGLSLRADDDGDGRLDEDPLDGRDNDGDGRIDEDYAAVGDAMLVVDRGADRGRIEYYSWAHPYLRRIVFAAPAAGEQALGAVAWRLRTEGTDWVETVVKGLHHDVGGRCVERSVPAWISRVEDVAGAPERWLAVANLDTPTADGRGRAILDGRDLSLRLGPDPLPVVIVTGSSWLELVRGLINAEFVHEGVRDPVNDRHVSWVVPPSCSLCRGTDPISTFVWRLDRGDMLTLSTSREDAGAGVDPDRFRLGTHDLGAPDQIIWNHDDDDERGVGWYAMSGTRLARTGVGLADPYLSETAGEGHGWTGEVSYRFRTVDPGVLRLLTGHAGSESASELLVGMVGGPQVGSPLRPDLRTADPVRSAVMMAMDENSNSAPARQDQSRLLRAEQSRPNLAPELLHGWPNPFRDFINLRITVPRNMGEAFVWERDGGPPVGINANAPVPWSGGSPTVSVRIYSLGGRELRTLHEGLSVTGEVVVQWDGNDAFGRKVASGTYFCKLQMDEWSTTRRVVFVR